MRGLGGVVRPSFLVFLLLGAACGGPLPVGDPDGGRDGSWVEDATSPPDDAVAPPDDAVAPPDDTAPPADVPVGPCGGECDAHRYTTCTCGAADPCGWAGNGLCDGACDSVLPSGHFDDAADCGPPPVCGGDCDAHRYTACSCGADDPCRWSGNGTCDAAACAGVAGADFDDSADCVPAGRTFGLTSVRTDGLDASDADDFASGVTGLGYTQLFADNSASTSDLRTYLGRSDLTVLYHTGHGDAGIVLTTDGYLTVSAVSPGGIRAQHVIFATCLTLRESWAGAFGSTAQTVMGYTNYSYDYLDNDVVDAMISPLRAGRSWIYAWYQANVPFDMVADRWAGYVREGSTIVEYSARTGRRPSADLADVAWVAVPGTARVLATAELLVDVRTFGRSAVAPRVAEAAEPAWWVAPEEFGALGPGVGDEEAAAAAAREWLAAHGGVPEGAVPAAPLAVVRRGDAADPGTVVGRVVRWARIAAGLPVQGNLVAHHVALLVGPGGVVAESRYWPELAVEGGEEAASSLTVAEAVRAAAPALERTAKGREVRLIGAAPVWGARGARDRAGDPLVPAWALRTAEGFSLVVEAATGALLL